MLVIGHRHSLPQHKIMGEIDGTIMKLIEYPTYIVTGTANDK